MELDHWIAIYAAISQSASSRERSRWGLLAAGMVAGSLLVAVVIYVLGAGRSTAVPAAIGLASLGLAMSMVWLLGQHRLRLESHHWQRILRSLESQFAGAEFHRNLHRLLKGEEVCVPSAAWVCQEWQPEAARCPSLLRAVPDFLIQWVPFAFGLAFLTLLIVSAIM